MTDQVLQQGVPLAQQQPQQVPAQATATPQAPMAQPSAQQPAPDPVEVLKQRLAQQEEQTRRLAGIQASKDRQLYEANQRFEAEKAQMQRALQEKQLSEMPDEDRAKAEIQMLRQEKEQLQQQMVMGQWRDYLGRVAQEHTSRGVPQAVMEQAWQQAQDPQTAALYMQAAAADYWYQRAQGQPAPQPVQQQAQPVMQQPQPQQQVPQYPGNPQPTVHPTSYSQAQPPSSIDDEIQALRDRTVKNRESTVEEGLAALHAKWARER